MLKFPMSAKLEKAEKIKFMYNCKKGIKYGYRRSC